MLPIFVNICIAVVGFSAGSVYGVLLRRRGVGVERKPTPAEVPAVTLLGGAFVLVFLSYFIVGAYAGLAWHLPFSVRYFFDLPSLWWSTLVIIIGFCFGGASAVSGRRSLVIGLIVFAIGFGLTENTARRSPLTMQPVVLDTRIDEQKVVRQTHGSTCAAAACVQILLLHNESAEERDLVKLLGTTINGTSPAQVYYGLRHFGFKPVKRRIRDRDYTRLTPPAILFIDLENEPLAHTVTYLGLANGSAVILDPAVGRQLMTREELAVRWRGHAIEIPIRELDSPDTE